MKNLRNEEDWRILKKRMELSREERVTISFYKYAHIVNPHFFRDYLFANWSRLGVFGRTYVAREGINAQISVPLEELEAFKQHLYNISFLDGIRLNCAVDDDGKSFYKLIIKARDKILADGLNDEEFDVTDRGKHLKAGEFNALIDRDDTILIDMRNHYEHEVGHFAGALTPDVDTFRDSLAHILENLRGYEDRNIAMYCTGGIRCEKASAYFKHMGFPKVHQLDGGIIEYARQVERQKLDNKFIGKNFVFDERLGERISDEVIAKCHQCGKPCDDHTNCLNKACHVLFIQCKECREKFEGCCSDDCRDAIHLSEEEQKALRAGVTRTPQQLYHKGKSPSLRFRTVHNPKLSEKLKMKSEKL